MKNIPKAMQLESIESFQSTIRKCENALAQMTEKGSNTTLLERRLKALRTGLDLLENAWHQKPVSYSWEELVEAREVLTGLLPSIEKAYGKSKDGSPQKTLLERRIKSLELAIHAIDDFSA